MTIRYFMDKNNFRISLQNSMIKYYTLTNLKLRAKFITNQKPMIVENEWIPNQLTTMA